MEIQVREMEARSARRSSPSRRAFWPDPLFGFFSRDLLHEYRLLPALFGAALHDLDGPLATTLVALHGGRPRAVGGWLGPGGFPRSAREEAVRSVRMVQVIGRARNHAVALRLLREVDRQHPHEPHWYLALLATDPIVQGRGFGTALLAPILERCDREGLPAYLETQKESNVAWYARSGFRVSEEVRLPGAPPVWCLRREPLAG